PDGDHGHSSVSVARAGSGRLGAAGPGRDDAAGAGRRDGTFGPFPRPHPLPRRRARGRLREGTGARDIVARDVRGRSEGRRERDPLLYKYTKAAKEAGAEGDIGSRLLFEQIVLDEEGHKAWLETQLDLIERLGEAVYAVRFLGASGAEG